MPIFPSESGPQGVVFSGTGQIPTLAARSPYGAKKTALDVGVVLALNIRLYIYRRQLFIKDRLDSLDDVIHSGLNHVDHRVVTQARIRAGHHEEIREPGHGTSLVRLEAIFTDFAQILPVTTVNFDLP